MTDVTTASWTLTDVELGVYLESFELTPQSADLGRAGGDGWSIRKRRLRGGASDGVDLIDVDNGRLSFSILPTRGMGIWRARCGDLDLGWQAAFRGPVHPSLVNLTDRGGLGWLAGFDELIVRCGLDNNGAPCVDQVPDNNGNPQPTPLPLHGRIANSPACCVAVEVLPGDPAVLVVTGEVEEATLFNPNLLLRTRISTAVGSNSFTIEDEVVNRRGIEAELQMLYHCNFGRPILEEGSRLLAPSLRVAPREAVATQGAADYATYRGPTPGYIEQVYYHELVADADGRSVAALVNKAADRAAVVRFDRNQLGCFAQWKNTIPDGDGYVTGLEPATNFPNPKPFERQNGRVVKLAAGESWKASLTVEAIDSADGVAKVTAEIKELLAGKKSDILLAPRAGWSPGA